MAAANAHRPICQYVQLQFPRGPCHKFSITKRASVKVQMGCASSGLDEELLPFGLMRAFAK